MNPNVKNTKWKNIIINALAIFSLLIMHSVLAMAHSDSNLIANPSFESGKKIPLNWTFVTQNGNTPVWDNISYTGSKSVKISVSGTINRKSGYPRSDLIIAQPLTSYKASVWGKTQKAGGINAPAVRVVELDAKKNWIRQNNILPVFGRGTNDWSQRTIEFQTDAKTRYIYVYANIWNGYGDFWLDEVILSLKNTSRTTTPAPTPAPAPTAAHDPMKPTVYAGWRSSAYGYQIASPPSYWVNVATAMSKKFPGTTPGGIWLVGETDGNPATGTLLYMPSSGSYPNIRFEGADIAEPYLKAFDAAGVKVILQVEPMNADIMTLIDIVMNRYKDHPSVIGFGIDNEWYKTCPDGCKATAADVISWNNKLHSINPDYILMIKHFEESKLPTGIPADVLVIGDDEQNGDLDTLVSEHIAMENQYPNNPYGAQIGYPSDNNIWDSMSDPAKQLGLPIQTAIGRPISVFWVDFSITKVFPPSQYNGG